MRARSCIRNGFCRNLAPGRRNPWRTMASSVYPDMNRTFIPLSRGDRETATSWPPMFGIRDQQVDRSAMAHGDAHRLCPVARFEHGVPVFPEDIAREHPHHVLVLDEEDGLVPTGRCRR